MYFAVGSYRYAGSSGTADGYLTVVEASAAGAVSLGT